MLNVPKNSAPSRNLLHCSDDPFRHGQSTAMWKERIWTLQRNAWVLGGVMYLGAGKDPRNASPLCFTVLQFVHGSFAFLENRGNVNGIRCSRVALSWMSIARRY